MTLSSEGRWSLLGFYASGMQGAPSLLVVLSLGVLIAALFSTVPAVAAPSTAEFPIAADIQPLEDPGENLNEVQSYERYFGVPVQIAERNLAIQRRGAGIVELLKSALGDRYAGVWFDNENGEFVVPMLTSTSLTSVADVLEGIRLAGDFRTELAKYSWEELEIAQSQIGKTIHSLDEKNLVLTSLDPRTNAVVIHIAESVSNGDERELETVAMNQDMNVEVRPSNIARFDVETKACLTYKPRTCGRPLRGGVALTPEVGPNEFVAVGECTAGFKATGKIYENRFLLTAGHCAYKFPGKSWASRDVTETEHHIGPVEEYNFGPTGDWAKIKVNGSQYWDVEQPQPWPSRVAHFWENQEYPIEYEAWSWVGESVCFSGNRSGTSCGIVKEIHVEELYNEEPNTFLPPENAVDGVCVEPGDSGGPLFLYGKNTALGLLSGAIGYGCGATSYYVDITSATTNLGVTVGTRIGGQPSALTGAASNVQAYQATANGSINTNQVETSYHFEYGPTTAYGSSVPVPNGNAGHEGSSVPVSAPMSSLQPVSTYHFRLMATSAAGTAYGLDLQFTTAAAPPGAATAEATSVISTAATLNGTVNPNGTESKYYFEYGPTAAYGTSTPEVSAGSGRSDLGASGKVTGLEFGKTYHYRLVAKNVAGTSYGSDRIFTTGWRLQSNPPPGGAKSDELAATSCLSATNCMGVGNYVSSSGVEEPLAELWNGSSWEMLTAEAPPEATQSSFQGVSCLSTASCTAVGFFFRSGKALPFAERWNGTEWEAPTVMEPEKAGTKLNRSYLLSVSCSSSTVCTAVGWYLPNEGPERGVTFAERGNGTGWTAEFPENLFTSEGESSQEENTLSSVSCASSTDCIAVGLHRSSKKATPHLEALGEHWNGTKWEAKVLTVKEQTDGWLRGVSCSSTTACTAIGYSANGIADENVRKPLAMRWNGSTWAEQTTPTVAGSPSTYFEAVACPTSTSCLAVGRYGSTPVGMRWNGSPWELHVLPSSAGTVNLYLGGISCVSSTSCLAVGAFTNGSGYHGSLSEIYQKVLPPTTVTKAATGATESEATLKGTVNPNGSEAKYWFEYGLTTGYGTKTAETSAGSGSSPVEESKAISGLEAGVKYHFRIAASNSESTAYGKDEVVETQAGTKGQLASMKVTDPFNETTSGVSNFGTNWSALGWVGGTTPKGLDRTTGWGPSDAYSTVNGAYYQPGVTDVGSGIADQATMATNPGGVSRYFSLWLDMGPPGSTRSGYELRFTDTATNTYAVTLSKWVSGSQTVLATKEGYSFFNGNSFALADKGGTVSAWTNTGSGFGQILTVTDSAFSGGNSGVEGSGNITRLTNFKVGWLLYSVTNTDAALKALPLTDAFATNESPLSEGGLWFASAWDNSSSGHNTGQDTTSGWGPYDSSPTINGAFWAKAFSDTGGGDAVTAVFGTSPGAEGNYFSLWLNASNPPVNHNGLELRFIKTGSNYEVALLKWTAGTKTVLGSKTGYSFAAGSKFALVDKAGTASAWTNTGTEYTQILSGSDSPYNGGYPGVEGSGSSTRLKEFRSGPMAPF